MLTKANILIVLFITLVQILSQDKQVTQIDFISTYALGKQNQLNKTFQYINQKLPSLPNVIYHNQTLSYQITNLQPPRFFYINSNQKATIQNPIIKISGGYLQTELKFNWQKKFFGISNYGNATAFGRSNSISFQKMLIINQINKAFYFNLSYYEKIQFDLEFKITRISPPSVKQQDIIFLTKMLNYIYNQKSVKDYLVEAIDSIYSYSLKKFINNEKITFYEQFNYTYKNKYDPLKQDFVINMTADIKNITLDHFGIQYDWKTNITDYSNWRYLDHIIKLPLNPKIYGGLQQIVSFTVYENLIRYAIEKSKLNSELNKINWSSKLFKFICENLFEVIPKIAEFFSPKQPVYGQCYAIQSGFQIKKNTEKTFNTTIQYKCQIYAKMIKINQFNIKLNLQIEGIPKRNYLNFQLVKFSHSIKFNQITRFKIENEQLAKEIVKQSLSRLYEIDLFGNGWKLFERNYPLFFVQQDFTLVYDPTYIDLSIIKES